MNLELCVYKDKRYSHAIPYSAVVDDGSSL